MGNGKLTIFKDTSDTSVYSAIYDSEYYSTESGNEEEAHNLARNGTIYSAIDHALDVWGLNHDEVNIDAKNF